MNEFIEKTNYREKKVASAEIIVTGTKDKPYFEIKYKEVGKKDYSIGYSSYDLNNVFDWKEDCFEIVNELVEEYKGGWIPCSERLPETRKDVLIFADDNSIYIGHLLDDGFSVGDGEGWIGLKHILAWQHLPGPYKEEKH